MGKQCMRDDGRCCRCSLGCHVIVPCNRCGEEFLQADMDNDGYCPDCAEVVAERRAADDRAAEEAEERRRENLADEQNRKDG